MPVSLRIDNYDTDEFVRQASEFGQDKYGFAVTPNVDHLIRLHDDPAFRALYADSTYILLDSRFLSFLFLLTCRVRSQVCTGSDLTAELFARVMRPEDAIILIGGDESQAKLLADRYGLKNLRHFNPPMGFIRDAAAVEECLQFVESNSPFRFCLLGVGAPQQEIIAQLLKARGKARGLALCIGASINFLTGAERRAPRWMQRIGAEWICRLMHDPRRLAKRYLVRGPWVFALLPFTKIVLSPPVAGAAIGASVGLNATTGKILTQVST